jgi:hypothetical protein
VNVATAHRLELAVDYERKLWCSDALNELERAVHDDPRLGENPVAIGVAIGCLRLRTQARAIHFLVESAGAAALPALADIEARDPRIELRAGASRARALIEERTPR